MIQRQIETMISRCSHSTIQVVKQLFAQTKFQTRVIFTRESP